MIPHHIPHDGAALRMDVLRLFQTVGDAADDLRHGGFLIALLQKQLDTDRQDPFFRGKACVGQCDGDHILSFCANHGIFANSIPEERGKNKRKMKLYTEKDSAPANWPGRSLSLSYGA